MFGIVSEPNLKVLPLPSKLTVIVQSPPAGTVLPEQVSAPRLKPVPNRFMMVAGPNVTGPRLTATVTVLE